MNGPYLVEESSLVQLAPILENLVKSLPNNATKDDYLIAVVIVVLAETGFFIPPDNDRERFIFINKMKFVINIDNSVNIVFIIHKTLDSS